MSGEVYNKLSSLSRNKLNKLQKEHSVHLSVFESSLSRQMSEIALLEEDYKKTLNSAKKELEESVLSALATTVDLRYIKANIALRRVLQ
jgi:hypothetical protein